MIETLYLYPIQWFLGLQEPYNFLEEEIRNVCRIIILVQAMKYAILENRSTTTMIASFPPRGPWEGQDEVNANVT